MVTVVVHSTLKEDLIKSQPPSIRPWQGKKALLRGPVYGFKEILANGASYKKVKN